jgi:hypothetical protein
LDITDALKANGCVEIQGQRITDTENDNPGAFVDEAENECGLGGDAYERWYKIVLDQRASIGYRVTFPNSQADPDTLFFVETENLDDFPQGIKIIGGSLVFPGLPESMPQRILEPGTYYFAISLFAGSPATDYTATVTLNTSPYQQADFEFLGLNFSVPPDPIITGESLCSGTFLAAAVPSSERTVVYKMVPLTTPAKLDAVRLLLITFQGQPNIEGRTIRLRAVKSSASDSAPPDGAPFVLDITVRITGANSAGFNGVLSTYPVNNGPILQEGEALWVGYSTAGVRGVPLIIDTGVTFTNSTFISSNSGMTWQPLQFTNQQGQTIVGNALIAGIFSNAQ